MNTLNLFLKRGSISIDFLFIFVVTILISIYFLMISLTLSLIEVAQYITFASAREYFIAHKTYTEHEINAQRRYSRLKDKFFPRQMRNWFEIGPEIILNDQEFQRNDDKPNFFIGVTTTFQSKALQLSIPFLGSGFEDEGEGLQMKLSSFLGREPSRDECFSFMRGRLEKFQQIPETRYPYQDREGISFYKSKYEELGNGC